MNKFKFTKEQIENMIKLKESGSSNQTIANHYGCSEATIRRTIKNFCLQSVSKIKKELNAEQITKIENEKEENKVENVFSEPVKTYEPIEKVCKRCGKKFVIPPYEQKLNDEKGYDLPLRCPECRELMRKKIEITCVDCNNVFTITVGKKEAMESRGLVLPKRCPTCLKFKKEANAKQIEKNAWKSPSLDFDPDKD